MNKTLLKESAIQQQSSLELHLKKACKKIAPLWSLENFVAVNPYLGLVENSFESTAQYLSKVGGIQMTKPSNFYLKRLENKEILKKDIQVVLEERKNEDNVNEFLNRVKFNAEAEAKAPQIFTFTDFASEICDQDWHTFYVEKMAAWAASYFDKGQSIWNTSAAFDSMYASWKFEAQTDRSPEIQGLNNFREKVKALPEDPKEAAKWSLEYLGITEKYLPFYLHKLLLNVGGWSAYIAQLDWDSKLYKRENNQLLEFLEILICAEALYFQCLWSEVNPQWYEKIMKLSTTKNLEAIDSDLEDRLVLHEAFQKASQRSLIKKLNQKKNTKENTSQKKAQAIFCIDVRSEVFRRNLEKQDSTIETLGFAGFFGFPIHFEPLGSHKKRAQGPALIPMGPTVKECAHHKSDESIILKRLQLNQRIQKTWKSLKSGAVSCFGYVSPLGLSYVFKLISDSFGLSKPSEGLQIPEGNKAKNVSLEVEDIYGISPDERVAMATNALKAMSFTKDFAPFVFILGHGSSSVNNPHASGLDCGACGGNSGEANAKVAAGVFNDPYVRQKLKEEGISIPKKTIFLAGLHDTTTDDITVFENEILSTSQKQELVEIKKSFKLAGKETRNDRAKRMSITNKVDQKIKRKGNDWSEIRPEWGLAGCDSFIIAPRQPTSSIDLQGKSFLHSYDWQSDKGFKILEAIMTAPMVVTSWINLQYFASSVDPKNLGSGNKTLHNVTSGIGVIEGASGDLKVGLPLQSVHDGEQFQHEPTRLNVIIEAPIYAINEIIENNPSVKNLVDNGWIALLAMNEEGKVTERYLGFNKWEEI